MRFGIQTRSTLLMLFVLSFASNGANASEFDYCACLQASSHVAEGRRDAGAGVSIIVPQRAVRKTYWLEYSRLGFGASWSTGFGQIRIANRDKPDSSRMGAQSPWKRQCRLQINGHTAEISTLKDRNSIELDASFEDPLDRQGIYDLIIRAKYPREACVSAAKVFWSAVPDVDFRKDLRLLAIAPDHRSFAYTNSIGVQMSAKVGDYISREDDRVVRIAASTVTVMGLEPDGAGGWREVERQLVLEPAQQAK